MATAVDFWNEVDRRISARLGDISGMAGTESADGTSAPPPAAGGLPIHNNAHHEPPLALQSDLESLTFLDLLDTPAAYAGSPLFLLRVNAGATAVEFADGSLLYDAAGAAAAAVAAHVAALDPHTQYYNQARGDARYSLLGHLQAVTAGGTALTGIAADNLIYSSAIDTFSPTPITAYGRSLIDDANASAARTTLELNAGEAGDIWVEKAGDTMTGNLRVDAAIGINVAPAGVIYFHLKKDANTVTDAVYENQDAGAAAQVRFQLRNGASANDGLTVGMLGTGFTTNGAFIQDYAYISAEPNIGGLSIIARNAAADIRFYTGGFAAGNLRLIALGTGEIGIGTATPGALVDIMHISAPVLRLSRNDTTVTLSESLGKVEFYGNDTQLTTQNIFGNIEVQAQAAIATDAAFGKMLLRTTGPGTATSPVERLGLGLVKTLTDAATDLFDVTLNAGQMAGGTVIWTIIASNGTDHQAYSGIVTYAVVNKAGAYTTQITHNTTNDSKAVSSGTLTAVWAILNGANKVTIRVTPTGSLTETTYQILYSVHSNSPQSIAIL